MLEHCESVNTQLTGLMQIMLIIVVFGSSHPLLMLLSPALLWLRLCSYTWVRKHRARGLAFGVAVATSLVVQQPTSTFFALMHSCFLIFTGLVLYDLKFDNGVVIFYSVLYVAMFVATFGIVEWHKRSTGMCKTVYSKDGATDTVESATELEGTNMRRHVVMVDNEQELKTVSFRRPAAKVVFAEPTEMEVRTVLFGNPNAPSQIQFTDQL